MDVFVTEGKVEAGKKKCENFDFGSGGMREEYVKLHEGLRSRRDPVTWRTMICKIKYLLGVGKPDWEKLDEKSFEKAKGLVGELVDGTYLQELKPEIYDSLGMGNVDDEFVGGLSVLLFNGRHFPEELLWKVADCYKRRGKSVAVVNPVGHYNDGETRIVAPGSLKSRVKKLVILASTQEMYGGSVGVLANVVRTVRNVDFSRNIGEVCVVIPMFGGSRSDKDGQSREIGYEVQQAIFDAKLLAETTSGIVTSLRKELEYGQVPKISFFSVDIHGTLYPRSVFQWEGFSFTNICPMEEFAGAVCCEVEDRNLGKKPVVVVASDNGAVHRAERFAEGILRQRERAFLIYMDKKRKVAGEVDSLSVSKIKEWEKGEDGAIYKSSVEVEKIGSGAVRVIVDDMLDTGGTAEKDSELMDKIIKDSSLKVFVATHPIVSKGILAIDRTKADVVFLGNTLNPADIKTHSKARIVDLAESIVRKIGE